MSYDPRPNSGDTLSGTLNPIRTNFEVLEDRFDENHVELDGGSGGGKHKFLQMPEQSAAPTTAVNEGGVYTKVGTNPAEANLFFRGESSGKEYQLTHTIQASQALFGTSPNGWIFLAGGLILQYGTITNPGTSGTVTFTDANINFPNSIIQVQLQLYHNSSGNESATVKQDDPPTTALFKYRTTSSSANTRLKWWAVGN